MTNSTSETPYDVVMKTAEVELSCHMNIDLQSRYLWHRKWKQGERKKNFILFKIQSKRKFILTKIAFKKALLSKDPARGPVSSHSYLELCSLFTYAITLLTCMFCPLNMCFALVMVTSFSLRNMLCLTGCGVCLHVI